MMIVYLTQASPQSSLLAQGMVWAPTVTEALEDKYWDHVWSFVPKDAQHPRLVLNEEENNETLKKYGTLDRTIMVTEAQLLDLEKTASSKDLTDYRKKEKQMCKDNKEREAQRKRIELARFEAEKIRKKEDAIRRETERLKEIERVRFAAEPFPKLLMSLEGALEVGMPGIFETHQWGAGPLPSRTVKIRFEAMNEYLTAIKPDTMDVTKAVELWKKIRKSKVEPYASNSIYNRDLVHQMHGIENEKPQSELLALDYLTGLVSAQLLVGGFTENQATNYACYRSTTSAVAKQTKKYTFSDHVTVILNDYERLFPKLKAEQVLAHSRLKEILLKKSAFIEKVFGTYSGYAFIHYDIPIPAAAPQVPRKYIPLPEF